MGRAVVQVPVTLLNHDLRCQQGLLRFRKSERRLLFPFCGKRFSIDDSDWPASSERHSKVLAIGKDLDQAALAAQPVARAVAA